MDEKTSVRLEKQKNELLEDLRKKGFSDIILEAFEKVPREKFVPLNLQDKSYNDIPLPIGYNQTISQPYTIAFMLELLELDKLKSEKSKTGDDKKILEVGSGCGYVLALLSSILPETKIFGIERISELVQRSRKVLEEVGLDSNVNISYGDGSKGLSKLSKEKEIFDRILVSAACKEIPKKLFEQLKENGVLVIPTENSIVKLRKVSKEKNKMGYEMEKHPGFRFVPLIGNGKS